jgi:hypothetical protein
MVVRTESLRAPIAPAAWHQQVEQDRAPPLLVHHAEWPSPRPIPKSFEGMHAVAHRRACQGGRLAAHAHRTMQIVLSLRASILFATAVELVL